MIIEHHTSIHTIIHEANNGSKLEQYINDRKISKRVRNMILRIAMNRERHANRSYGLKETVAERSTHKRKYKTISFMCFNYIKAYIN